MLCCVHLPPKCCGAALLIGHQRLLAIVFVVVTCESYGTDDVLCLVAVEFALYEFSPLLGEVEDWLSRLGLLQDCKLMTACTYAVERFHLAA